MDVRVSLNGKKAGLEEVRAAVREVRAESEDVIEVRVTWEAGDAERLVREAVRDCVGRVVAGGGDGTVNEVGGELLRLFDEGEVGLPELAILPLGTANDFATACGVPVDLVAALRLARDGDARAVDGVKAGDRYFLNVASGGFGAEVTANTPVALKNFLGGGAYTLAGVAQALKFEPYRGVVRLPGFERVEEVVVGAVCNGPQAGGGQVLAPDAKIDDGLLDMVSLEYFPPEEVATVVRELVAGEENGKYVKRHREPWMEWESEEEFPVNLDGEPMRARKLRFEVMIGVLDLVLPEGSEVIGQA